MEKRDMNEKMVEIAHEVMGKANDYYNEFAKKTVIRASFGLKTMKLINWWFSQTGNIQTTF